MAQARRLDDRFRVGLGSALRRAVGALLLRKERSVLTMPGLTGYQAAVQRGHHLAWEGGT